VHATDISMAALEVAKENANKLSANIQLHYHNILSQHLDEHGFDVVVSNPPYIKQSEAATMEENVLRYEPHLALFVPDEDALKFYKAICSEAMRILKPQGLLAVEVNASHANEVAELFADNDFKSVTIVKDLYGKDRIVKALKPT
jgi:release factor glutamine methyltransferase